MINALLALLLCQLAGEAITTALNLPLPGPVIGMVFLLVLFLALPRATETVRPVAQGFLSHLSLLFVPAGVGVVGQIAVLGNEAAVLILAVVVSTVLSMMAAALAFVAVARVTGNADE